MKTHHDLVERVPHGGEPEDAGEGLERRPPPERGLRKGQGEAEGAHHQGQQEGEPVGGVQDGQGGGRRLEAGGEVAHEGDGVLVGGGLERKMEDYLINEKIGENKVFFEK